MLVDSDACNLFFEWRTELLCAAAPPLEMDCEAVDAASGRLFDLSPLAGTAWAAAAGADNFALSVCGGLACGTKAAGACKTNASGAYSMGMGAQPEWTADGLVLQYSLVRAVPVPVLLCCR